MKNISEYINEALTEYANNIPQEVKSFCYRMMQGLEYSKLEEIKDDDPDRFEKSKNNEELLRDALADDSYDFMTISEYYGTLGKDVKWENLSSEEQADFDRKNGNIIIVKNEKPIYFIDVKVGATGDVGSVSLGSLVEFNENGYYLCVSKNSGQKYKVVSHKDLVKAVKENPKLLNPVVNKDYKGFDITWEGEQMTSEYFVKGKDLYSNFK